MGLILRVDVDKAYGRKTVSEKVRSKLREDYWFPAFDFLGYLKATEIFIKYCNSNEIQGVFYFRICTLPSQKILRLLEEGNHQIGFHAENTRSLSSFKKELEQFKRKLPNTPVSSFTKHGSGDIKIGKNHYAPYEPEKYKSWSKETGLDYKLGNEISDAPDNFKAAMNFYPKMFWVHNDYRDEGFNTIQELVSNAKVFDIPVVIHPSNFLASDFVNTEFKELVNLAKDASIPWKLIS